MLMFSVCMYDLCISFHLFNSCLEKPASVMVDKTIRAALH